MFQRVRVDTLGKRLKFAREHADLGTNELTRQAGISQGLVTRLEKDQGKRPGADTIKNLARALKVRADWLLDGEGPMAAEEAPPADSVVEPIYRYDNQAKAARAARELGYPEEAIATGLSIQLEADVDPEADEWLEWIKIEARKLKYARKDPAAAERERQISTVNVATVSEQMREQREAALREREAMLAEQERKRAGGG